MKLFNHVQIKVKDLERSRKFYDCIMVTLGYPIVLEINNVLVGYGKSVHEMFEIRQFDLKYPESKNVHIAFNAPCKEDVEAFYTSALENGGTCNGKPGFRPEYEDDYYAAFVIDPDGHNIEAVYSQKTK